MDVAEWTCRLSTAAVTVAEAARRPTEDVFFDAAAVGPRAAAAVLLAAAHPSPDVHAAAAALLAAAEDLVDVAALSGDAMGHGADAGEDAETALASKLGGGCAVGSPRRPPRPGDQGPRGVYPRRLERRPARRRLARGRAELGERCRCPPRRRAPRRVARRGVRARRRRPGARHVELAQLPPVVAAARPVGTCPCAAGRRPGALSGAPGEVSPSAVTPRKMLFAEDKAALGAAADASASTTSIAPCTWRSRWA